VLNVGASIITLALLSQHSLSMPRLVERSWSSAALQGVRDAKLGAPMVARALADVVPVDTDSVYRPLMQQLGYDPDNKSTDIEIRRLTCDPPPSTPTIGSR
jgi:hypothetical protein